jgi:Xaa-Pro aminopeptidase
LRGDIDEILIENGLDALLLYCDSFKNENMYYLTKFLAPDPFILLKKVDREPIIVIKLMEHARALKESSVKDVRSYDEYDYLKTVKSFSNPQLGVLKFIAKVTEKELRKGTKIYVPPNFPTIVTDALRKQELTIKPMFNIIERTRETKDDDELEEIRFVQRITEEATTRAIETIADAQIGANKTLFSKMEGNKEPLTVKKIKTAFGRFFLEKGCTMEEEIIVACGPRGADPHYFGNPQDKLKANQPIILDVYPRSQRKRYWSDMTRTVVRGTASKNVKRMFEAVLEAKYISSDAIRAGIIGSEIHNLCCDTLEKAGYKTIRGGKKISKGFIHSLGHGVGLQIHEGPYLSEIYTSPLKEHNVITVEPGLYDPNIGGIRIEDIVEVTKQGYNNLTKMEIRLEI